MKNKKNHREKGKEKVLTACTVSSLHALIAVGVACAVMSLHAGMLCAVSSLHAPVLVGIEEGRGGVQMRPAAQVEPGKTCDLNHQRIHSLADSLIGVLTRTLIHSPTLSLTHSQGADW
jgi:hypothetical protein